jgi:magnesium transporter
MIDSNAKSQKSLSDAAPQTAPNLDRSLFRKIEEACYQNDNTLIRSSLLSLHHIDIAHFLALSTPEIRKQVVVAIRDEFTAELLLAIHPGITEELIEALGIAECSSILSMMEGSDAVSILEDLSEDLRARLIVSLPESIRNNIAEQLAYPDNSAGRLMHRPIVSVLDYWTVGQTIDYLRYNRSLPLEFYEVFVLNQKYQPVGAVAASRVLCSKREVPIIDIMNKDFRIIQADLDQEEVSYLFTEYELTSAPVVNKEGRLIGALSLSDVVGVIEEEAEEDILRLGGVGESDIHTSFYKTATKRLPWLLINLCIAVLTCSVIRLFEGTISDMVMLAAVMPIVASLGGNAGTQTLTVAVRSIATKELSSVNAMRVILKEMAAGLFNGISCAAIGGIVIYVWLGDGGLSLVFSLAIIITFTISGIMGAAIPLWMHRMKIDPAIASGIFLTGITDAVGFFTFLMLSTLLLLG